MKADPLLMSSVMSSSSWSCWRIILASTWSTRSAAHSRSTRSGRLPRWYTAFPQGVMHRLLAPGGKRHATNVLSGRDQSVDVFYVPLDFSPGVAGERPPNCNRLLKTVVDTAGGRGYNAANLYIVLDRIVKPHI